MKKLVFVAVAVCSFLALALTQQLELVETSRLTAMPGGLHIGPKSMHTTNDKINADRITRTLGATATVDFAAGTIKCDLSSAITVLGARTGDPCHVGAPTTLGYDGGAGLNATFTCHVSANDAVKIKHCPAGTADDPPSASYQVRVISSQ
jgi:hypothetical protein